MFWADDDVEFMEAIYEPAARPAPTTHSCTTAATSSDYVLSGRLCVTVGSDEFCLEPGDSITFPSTTPHRLANGGTRDGARDLGRPRPARR